MCNAGRLSPQTPFTPHTAVCILLSTWQRTRHRGRWVGWVSAVGRWRSGGRWRGLPRGSRPPSPPSSRQPRWKKNWTVIKALSFYQTSLAHGQLFIPLVITSLHRFSWSSQDKNSDKNRIQLLNFVLNIYFCVRYEVNRIFYGVYIIFKIFMTFY